MRACHNYIYAVAMERRFLADNKGLLLFGFLAPPALWVARARILGILVAIAVCVIVVKKFQCAYREWRLRRAHAIPEPSSDGGLPSMRDSQERARRTEVLERSMGAFTRRSARLAGKEPDPATGSPPRTTAATSKQREE